MSRGLGVIRPELLRFKGIMLDVQRGPITVQGVGPRVRIESVSGLAADGASSDLLVPRWFRKDIDRTAADDQVALRQHAMDAARACLAAPDSTSGARAGSVR